MPWGEPSLGWWPKTLIPLANNAEEIISPGLAKSFCFSQKKGVVGVEFSFKIGWDLMRLSGISSLQFRGFCQIIPPGILIQRFPGTFCPIHHQTGGNSAA